MDADEKDIVTYLKVWSGQFVSAREIARKAASKRRYEKEPDWAVPALGRLVEKGIVEADPAAHYRFIPDSKKEKPKRWISPELKKILERTGKDFSEGVEISPPEAPKKSGEESSDD